MAANCNHTLSNFLPAEKVVLDVVKSIRSLVCLQSGEATAVVVVFEYFAAGSRNELSIMGTALYTLSLSCKALLCPAFLIFVSFTDCRF